MFTFQVVLLILELLRSNDIHSVSVVTASHRPLCRYLQMPQLPAPCACLLGLRLFLGMLCINWVAAFTVGYGQPISGVCCAGYLLCCFY
jgi:hypothetical protein